MQEQLDKLVGLIVTVVVPLDGTISLSFREELQSVVPGRYSLSGNPAITFTFLDVKGIENGVIIRLTKS